MYDFQLLCHASAALPAAWLPACAYLAWRLTRVSSPRGPSEGR